MKNRASFKYNNGNGALLCSKCSVIIKTGKDFLDHELACCCHGGGVAAYTLPPQYCDKCKLEITHEYPRKYEQVFTGSEMRKLCDKIGINKDEFSEMLGINTGLLINNEFLTYMRDVELAVKCILKKRQKKISEWD